MLLLTLPELAHQAVVHVGHLAALPAQAPAPPAPGGGGVTVPNPAPGGLPQPAQDKLNGLLSLIKTLALFSFGATFFIGLIVFTAGRAADHRRGATVGTLMILASVGGGLLFGLGPGLIQMMAS